MEAPGSTGRGVTPYVCNSRRGFLEPIILPRFRRHHTRQNIMTPGLSSRLGSRCSDRRRGVLRGDAPAPGIRGMKIWGVGTRRIISSRLILMAISLLQGGWSREGVTPSVCPAGVRSSNCISSCLFDALGVLFGSAVGIPRL